MRRRAGPKIVDHMLTSIAQFCSTSFQGVQFMNQTEIFVINAIAIKNKFSLLVSEYRYFLFGSFVL